MALSELGDRNSKGLWQAGRRKSNSFKICYCAKLAEVIALLVCYQ